LLQTYTAHASQRAGEEEARAMEAQAAAEEAARVVAVRHRFVTDES